MGSAGKDEKMEDALSGRNDSEGVGAEAATGDGKPKEKEANHGQFSEGDKVLAYHGPLIYEAKIQRAEFRKNEWKYFVHYLGWSKNWDEWVGTTRLMALTDANLDIQKKLFKDQNVDKQTKGRMSQGKQKTPTESKGEKEGGKNNTVPKGKKRKAEATVSEEKDTDEPDHIMKIPLPAVLKKQLVDDWELIQSGKSIKLPRSPNVEEILKKYREFKTKRESTDEDSIGEVLNGLQSYFDKALPAMLLYKQERAQYAGVVPEGSTKLPSMIYGAEHLLRLFVKLPELLVYTNMEEETLTQLQQRLMDFLKFLQKNQSNFFLSMYDGPKIGAKVEPEEKKHKRDASRAEEEMRDKKEGSKVSDDKREKRIVQRATEEKGDKKDGSKFTEDRRERKDKSRTSEEKKVKSSDEKRDKERKQKDGSKVLDEVLRVPTEKFNKRNGLKGSGEKKERKDGVRLSDRKEATKSFAVEEKKEKKSMPKSSDEKNEKLNGSRATEEKKDRNEGPKSLDDKKVTEDKKERKVTAKNSDDKREKTENTRNSEESREREAERKGRSSVLKHSDDKEKRDVSKAVTRSESEELTEKKDIKS